MDKDSMNNTKETEYTGHTLNAPRAKSAPQIKTVEIKISLPSITRLPSRAKMPKVPRKILTISGGLCILIIAACVSYSYLLASHPPKIASDTKTTSRPASALQQGTPDYRTILPSGKSIETLGGWTRVSPPDRNPVFAYIDKIGTIPINVSQQPLPDGFESESDEQVEQLAAGYKANEKITAGNVTIYVGTSAKGPQSVIFSKEKLLVLIKSNARIENDQWAAYVNAMQ